MSYVFIIFFWTQLQDVTEMAEMEQYTKPPSRDAPEPNKNVPGFMVRDAPWNKVPDTTNTTDFPSIGSATNAAPQRTPAWGPPSKR